MMTEWRTCPGWLDFQVSNDGQLRRIRGPKHAKLIIPRALPVGPRGYVILRLSQDGRIGTVALHMLICEAFHGPRPSRRHQAAHWDGNKINNTAGNLRWALPVENVADTIRHGRFAAGERSGHALLTKEQVAKIRQAYPTMPAGRARQNSRAAELGARYGVTEGCIRSIIRHENWK